MRPHGAPPVIERSLATQPATATRPPEFKRSKSTPPETTTQPPDFWRLIATQAAPSTRPPVHMHLEATRPASETRLTVLMRSTSIQPATGIQLTVIKRSFTTLGQTTSDWALMLAVISPPAVAMSVLATVSWVLLGRATSRGSGTFTLPSRRVGPFTSTRTTRLAHYPPRAGSKRRFNRWTKPVKPFWRLNR